MNRSPLQAGLENGSVLVVLVWMYLTFWSEVFLYITSQVAEIDNGRRRYPHVKFPHLSEH